MKIETNRIESNGIETNRRIPLNCIVSNEKLSEKSTNRLRILIFLIDVFGGKQQQLLLEEGGEGKTNYKTQLLFGVVKERKTRNRMRIVLVWSCR